MKDEGGGGGGLCKNGSGVARMEDVRDTFVMDSDKRISVRRLKRPAGISLQMKTG